MSPGTGSPMARGLGQAGGASAAPQRPANGGIVQCPARSGLLSAMECQKPAMEYTVPSEADRSGRTNDPTPAADCRAVQETRTQRAGSGSPNPRARSGQVRCGGWRWIPAAGRAAACVCIHE